MKLCNEHSIGVMIRPDSFNFTEEVPAALRSLESAVGSIIMMVTIPGCAVMLHEHRLQVGGFGPGR